MSHREADLYGCFPVFFDIAPDIMLCPINVKLIFVFFLHGD